MHKCHLVIDGAYLLLGSRGMKPKLNPTVLAIRHFLTTIGKKTAEYDEVWYFDAARGGIPSSFHSILKENNVRHISCVCCRHLMVLGESACGKHEGYHF